MTSGSRSFQQTRGQPTRRCVGIARHSITQATRQIVTHSSPARRRWRPSSRGDGVRDVLHVGAGSYWPGAASGNRDACALPGVRARERLEHREERHARTPHDRRTGQSRSFHPDAGQGGCWPDEALNVPRATPALKGVGFDTPWCSVANETRSGSTTVLQDNVCRACQSMLQIRTEPELGAQRDTSRACLCTRARLNWQSIYSLHRQPPCSRSTRCLRFKSAQNAAARAAVGPVDASQKQGDFAVRCEESHFRRLGRNPFGYSRAGIPGLFWAHGWNIH